MQKEVTIPRYNSPQQQVIFDEFFTKFNNEVKITEIMGRLNKDPQTNNGVKQAYNCPFHSDSTPSFYVDTERNIYRCFGCNRSGGPYGLIKEWLIFESMPHSPSSVVSFSGVNLTFPSFYEDRVAQPDKRDKFNEALKNIQPNAKKPVDKKTLISRIMLGLSDEDQHLDLWEELLS